MSLLTAKTSTNTAFIRNKSVQQQWHQEPRAEYQRDMVDKSARETVAGSKFQCRRPCHLEKPQMDRQSTIDFSKLPNVRKSKFLMRL